LRKTVYFQLNQYYKPHLDLLGNQLIMEWKIQINHRLEVC